MTDIASGTTAERGEDPTAIRLDDFIPDPPAAVWRALTDSRLMARWLMENDFVLELGHRFQFRTTPMPDVKFSGIVHCQVLAIEPERLLRYSWGDPAAEHGLDSTVTWRLEPEGDGTRLYLEHAGFDPDHPLQQMGRRAMSGGWRTVARRIGAVLAEERPARS